MLQSIRFEDSKHGLAVCQESVPSALLGGSGFSQVSESDPGSPCVWRGGVWALGALKRVPAV